MDSCKMIFIARVVNLSVKKSSWSFALRFEIQEYSCEKGG